MKKSILALAVATASMAGVAQADQTTLYGSVRMAVQIADDGNDTTVAIDDAGSRWGIKGSDDLGNGLKAVYRFEWGANIMGTKKIKVGDKEKEVASLTNDGEGLRTRLGYVGLAGGFGEIQLGRLWSPYYDVMGYNDLFNDQFYNHYQGIFRLNNAVKYITPNMGGFQAKVALVANGKGLEAGDNEDLDAYNVSAAYDNNGIFAGLTYYATNYEGDPVVTGNYDKEVLGAALGYSNDMFRIGLVAERTDVDKSNAQPVHVNLAGEYYLTDMDTIRAGVAMTDYDVDGRDEAVEAAIGYQHKFSKRTRVWAEYGYQDSGVEGADSTSKLSLGLRTDF